MPAPPAERAAGLPLQDAGAPDGAGAASAIGSGRTALFVASGAIALPAFLPDATLGVVRGVDATDLEAAGVEALVMSVFHLMQKPGSSTIAALGGLHRMTGWTRPIVTDSGGFQAYSLVRQNAKFGSIGDNGIRFRPEGADRDFQLTPEKAVQLQLAYGTDIVVCLDDCTHVDDPAGEQQLSVERTVAWARRCKAEFVRQSERQRRRGDAPQPLLFAVVQGGGDAALRRRCAAALLEIGFDGYGYGGWPLDAHGSLVREMLALCREAIPPEFPLHALGVGHPRSIVECAAMGYDTFDSALPTRDARTGRLYVFAQDPADDGFRLEGDWFKTLYIDDDKHFKANRPISPGCDCLACRRYSVGYLRHLHKSADTLYFRLATLHNLRFMTTLMSLLRQNREGS
ncbi:MAG TPA: tRNA guanosine(34) transglycosylase Tgt [Chthonomonadaceae bacterium]|nr:tRNA guanosine(34) transglycosylase Tgt [Chthonomonadaceae bacterium]